MSDRITKLILVIGYTGTGKTSFSKKLIINELKKPESHILIVTPDDREFFSIPEIHPKFPQRIAWYKGARRVIYFKGLLPLIVDHFKNGLLLFDDCRAYFTASTELDLHNILIRRRQKMLDIIAAAHGFTDVPPKFFTFASEIVLFRTIDNIESRKNVLNDFEKMKEAQARINHKALSNPHYFEIIKQ